MYAYANVDKFGLEYYRHKKMELDAQFLLRSQKSASFYYISDSKTYT